jgi:hypothetical protein
MRRRGEPPGGRHLRSDRFVLANGEWYFTTREGMDVGPFATRDDAESACDRLLPTLQGLSFDRARQATEDFMRFELRRE